MTKGAPLFNRLALIGAGLIGSSIARAARASGAAWPAHMETKSGLPALAEAARNAAVTLFCAGNARWGARPISRMKRLAMPRAGLPEKRSVMQVSSSRTRNR